MMNAVASQIEHVLFNSKLDSVDTIQLLSQNPQAIQLMHLVCWAMAAGWWMQAQEPGRGRWNTERPL